MTDRIEFRITVIVYCCLHGTAPDYLTELCVLVIRRSSLHAPRSARSYQLIALPVKLSICVRPKPVLCLNERTYRHTFLQYGRGIILVLGPYRRYKFQGNSLSGGVKYTGLGKFCNLSPPICPRLMALYKCALIDWSRIGFDLSP